MIGRMRMVAAVAAYLFAGSPAAAQTEQFNPLSQPQQRRVTDRREVHQRRPRRPAYRLERHGRGLERRGWRSERLGDRFERRGRWMARHGHPVRGRAWQHRGDRLEHRGFGLERRGERWQRRGWHQHWREEHRGGRFDRPDLRRGRREDDAARDRPPSRHFRGPTESRLHAEHHPDRSPGWDRGGRPDREDSGRRGSGSDEGSTRDSI